MQQNYMYTTTYLPRIKAFALFETILMYKKIKTKPLVLNSEARLSTTSTLLLLKQQHSTKNYTPNTQTQEA